MAVMEQEKENLDEMKNKDLKDLIPEETEEDEPRSIPHLFGQFLIATAIYGTAVSILQKLIIFPFFYTRNMSDYNYVNTFIWTAAAYAGIRAVLNILMMYIEWSRGNLK